MDAITTGFAGMAAATQSFDASAARTASGQADLASEAVSQSLSKASFQAAAAVVKTADRMLGSLLDMTA